MIKACMKGPELGEAVGGDEEAVHMCEELEKMGEALTDIPIQSKKIGYNHTHAHSLKTGEQA